MKTRAGRPDVRRTSRVDSVVTMTRLKISDDPRPRRRPPSPGPTPTAVPVRTGRGHALARWREPRVVRAANASVHAPVDVAREADHRHRSPRWRAADGPGTRRAELKSRAGPREFGGWSERGGHRASSRRTLTRPSSAAQADAQPPAHARVRRRGDRPPPPFTVRARRTLARPDVARHGDGRVAERRDAELHDRARSASSRDGEVRRRPTRGFTSSTRSSAAKLTDGRATGAQLRRGAAPPTKKSLGYDPSSATR